MVIIFDFKYDIFKFTETKIEGRSTLAKSLV